LDEAHVTGYAFRSQIKNGLCESDFAPPFVYEFGEKKSAAEKPKERSRLPGRNPLRVLGGMPR
jgi:hypothetical protein